MEALVMIAQLASVIAITFAMLVGVRVLFSTLAGGPGELRHTMNEGAGFWAFLSGRLTNGQGATHLHEGHGLHFAHNENGEIAFERKSKVV